MGNSKLDQAIEKVFAAKTEKLLERALVLGNLACRDYEGEILDGGDTVKIIYEGDVTLRDSLPTDDSAISYDGLDVGTSDLKIDKDPYAAFKLSKVERKQLKGKKAMQLLEGKVKRAMYKFKKHIEDNLALLYAKAGIVGDAVTVTKSNVADALVAMQVKFDEADLPDEDRFAVLPAWAIGNMTLDDKNGYTETGAKFRKNGFSGTFAGFEIYKSNSIYKSGSVYYPIFGVKGESFALAVQENPQVEDASRPDRFEVAKKMMMLYGCDSHRTDKLGTCAWTKG